MEIYNLYAFCLPVALFLFWSLMGYAVLSVLQTQRNVLQNLLFAPAVGLGLTLLLVFWLNRSGLSVDSFGLILGLGLLSISLGLLYYKKPIYPFKRSLLFLGIILLGLYLIGRPLLEFGLDWLAFSNDDMTNYVLAALRFKQHGFFELPNINELSANKNYSLYYWIFHVPLRIRPGSDLILAWVSAITRQNPLQIFMVTVVAFHLTLISVSMGMVYLSKKYFYPALLTGLLLSFSPLNSLAIFSQLIAQVGGLSILILISCLLLNIFHIRNKSQLFRQSLLIGLMASSLFIIYPEVAPFLGLAFFVLLVIKLFKSWRPHYLFFISIGCIALITAIFLNSYMINFVEFLSAQMNSLHINLRVFNFYFMPSGLANLWGLQAISVYPSDTRWMDWSIIISGILLFYVFVSAMVLSVTRNFIYAIMTFVMLCLSIYLFINSADFGLYKLAMYIQPFLLATFVMSLSIFNAKFRFMNVIAVILLIYVIAPIQNLYINSSKAEKLGSYSEIPFASKSRIIKEYQQIISSLPYDSKILTTGFNQSLLKLQAFSSLSRELDMQMTTPYFRNFITGKIAKKSLINDHYKLLAEQLITQFKEQSFNLKNERNPDLSTDFIEYVPTQKVDPLKTYLIVDAPMRSVLNRSHFVKSPNNFVLLPWDKAKNILAFISSSRGRAYCDQRDILLKSLYNIEGDFFYPTLSTQAVNRYLLFRIINPTPTFRLKINLSNSWFNDAENKLPHLSFIGDKRVSTTIMGRGSARVFSAPVSPQWINGLPYIAIDMNQKGKAFMRAKSKILELYGKNIPLDNREIVTIARDISLVTEDQYNALNPPSDISHFPADLNNPDLEYSGIYEDGWISENAYFKLKQKVTQKKLIFKGIIARMADDQFVNQVAIFVDGIKRYNAPLQLGHFNIEIPLNPTMEKNRLIEVQFTRNEPLPFGDKRPVAAKMLFIGFL